MGAETWAVDLAAAARLTRLTTTDSFPPVKHLRERLLNRVEPAARRKAREKAGGEPPTLVELVECNWCAGFWISAGVLLARRFMPSLWDPIAKALATSMFVGLVAGVSEREGDLSDLSKTVDSAGWFVGTKLEQGLVKLVPEDVVSPGVLTVPWDMTDEQVAEIAAGMRPVMGAAAPEVRRQAPTEWQARNRQRMMEGND